MSHAAAFSPLQRSPYDRLMGRWSLDTSPAYVAMDLMSRLLSPYELNPLGLNPLRDILEESICFERLPASPIKLFITATNVRTGRGRIFRNGEITADVLLASACLPTMFQAIEIDGEAYWDGGYAGNPTMTPLVRETDAHDTILVQIIPRERAEAPRTAAEILNRLNEISFNSPLMKELRMIALMRQVADPGRGEGARWARDAHAQDPDRHAGRVRRLLQAQCGVGLPGHAAGGGPAGGRRIPGPEPGRPRQALHRRPGRAPGRVLSLRKFHVPGRIRS